MKQGGFKKYKKYFLITATAAVLILFLLPTHSADACIISTSPITNCIQQGMAYVLFLIFSIVGNIIAFLVKLLDMVIRIQIYPPGGVAVIDSSWKIMRNFANMFFIIALIMMAFATIFSITKYEARTLFPKFLISAILINFSLVLGTIVIDASQVLTNTFLTPIGDISAHLGEGLRPDKLLAVNLNDQATFATAIEQTFSSALIGLVFSLVLLMTMAFSLLTAAIFAIIRIPILWALLIVSPIAWILNVFPAGQGTFKKWWSLFIGWNMFLPIFLFFLYFGLYFLQSQDAIISAIAQQTVNQSLGEGVPFTFQIFFFYTLTAIFLIGGTITAMKASMFSGTGVVTVAKWSRGVAARRLGLAAAGQAWQEKKTQIQGGEGRLGRIFGGPPPGLETSRRLLGVRGADIKTQKEFVERAGKESALLQDQYDTGKINVDQIAAKAGQLRATDPQGYAYRKMAAKLGRLDDGLFESTLKQLSNNPYAAQDFAKTAKDSKFSNVGGSTLIQAAAGEGNFRDLGPNALPARREMYGHIQTNGVLLSNPNFGQSQFNTGLQLYGGHTTTEGKSYLENISKARPDLVIDFNRSNAQIMQQATERNNGVAPSRSQMFDSYLKDPKDIANIPKSVWEQDDFKQALQRKLTFGSPKAQRNFRNRVIDSLRFSANGEDKKNILNTLRGARDTDQGDGGDNFGEDDLDIDNEEGGGGTPPPAGPGPTTPPRTGRGAGNYPRGQVGFTPPTNPNNTVDLRNRNNNQ